MKFCVIGLGRFGRQVARTLAENGAEVLAVDAKEQNIAMVKNDVAQAICAEIISGQSLENIGIEEINVVILGIGENFDQAVLIAALLKKYFKNCTVIARATGTIQQEIFNLIGVDKVIRPEQETAIDLADTLSSPFTNLARFNSEFSAGLVQAPDSFVGKTVQDLELYEKYKLTCVAVKRNEDFMPVHYNYVILEHDQLVIAGKNENIEQLLHL